MKKSMGKRWGVNKWVSVVQDTNENRIWDALGDYMIDNGGTYLDQFLLCGRCQNCRITTDSRFSAWEGREPLECYVKLLEFVAILGPAPTRT